MFEDIEKLQLDKIYAATNAVCAYECPACGRLAYPAVMRCKGCGNVRYPEDEAEFVWHKKGYRSWRQLPLAGPCTLLTWTRLWSLPEGFTQRYLDLAIVEFPNGVRALGHLRVAAPAAGQALTATVELLRQIEGEDFRGLVFTAS